MGAQKVRKKRRTHKPRWILRSRLDAFEIFCQNCGTLFLGIMRFCPDCGVRQPEFKNHPSAPGTVPLEREPKRLHRSSDGHSNLSISKRRKNPPTVFIFPLSNVFMLAPPLVRGIWRRSCGGGFMLRIIEKPKGCLKVLSLLAEEEYVCVTDIISGWEMSQSSAYSSLKHLLGLGLISRADPLGRSGKRKKYVPTVSGRKLLKPLNAFFKSARYVLGKEDISSLLELPAESLESIVQFHKKGYVSLTDMLAEGVCKGTAKSILDALHEICLIKMAGARAGKSRRKKHSLTKRGECLAQILELVDETLDKMLHMKAPQT